MAAGQNQVIFPELKVQGSGVSAGHRLTASTISGDRALLKARDNERGEFSGAAYIFKREGETWVEEAKLTASDAKPNDQFGGGEIWDDFAIISASASDMFKGAAYVFERDSSNGQWRELRKLSAPDGSKGDQFGYSIMVISRS